MPEVFVLREHRLFEWWRPWKRLKTVEVLGILITILSIMCQCVPQQQNPEWGRNATSVFNPEDYNYGTTSSYYDYHTSVTEVPAYKNGNHGNSGNRNPDYRIPWTTNTEGTGTQDYHQEDQRVETRNNSVNYSKHSMFNEGHRWEQRDQRYNERGQKHDYNLSQQQDQYNYHHQNHFQHEDNGNQEQQNDGEDTWPVDYGTTGYEENNIGKFRNITYHHHYWLPADQHKNHSGQSIADDYREAYTENTPIHRPAVQQSMQQNMPQNMAQHMQQNVPQNVPPNMAQHMQQNVPQNIPPNMEQHMQQNVPQNVPPNMAQHIQQNGPQNVPQNMAQHMQQNVPQNMPQSTLQNMPQSINNDQMMQTQNNQNGADQVFQQHLASIFGDQVPSFQPLKVGQEQYVDLGYGGRPRRQKITGFIRAPVRRPSKMKQWQMIIRDRFNNHLEQKQRRKENENEMKSVQPVEYGTSVVDSFVESAMMPGAMLAFSMLFMDILGRLMPFSWGGRTTTTTTTTPPPKITKYEFTPPKIPTVADMMESITNKFEKMKAFKLKKKKKKKWMDSSEEDGKWRSGLPLGNKKKRKKGRKGGKRKSAPKLSMDRLFQLYQQYRPEHVEFHV